MQQHLVHFVEDLEHVFYSHIGFCSMGVRADRWGTLGPGSTLFLLECLKAPSVSLVHREQSSSALCSVIDVASQLRWQT